MIAVSWKETETAKSGKHFSKILVQIGRVVEERNLAGSNLLQCWQKNAFSFSPSPSLPPPPSRTWRNYQQPCQQAIDAGKSTITPATDQSE